MRTNLRLTWVLAGACFCALAACSSSDSGGGTGGTTGGTGGSETGGIATGGHTGGTGGSGGAAGQAGAAGGGEGGHAGGGGAVGGAGGHGGVTGVAGHGGAGGVGGHAGVGGAGGAAGQGGVGGMAGQGGNTVATDCNPACASGSVCVGTGTQGGALFLADAGTCPQGRHLQGNTCVQDLNYTCMPLPANCINTGLTCACAASTLCPIAGHVCATPSPGELTCILQAP